MCDFSHSVWWDVAPDYSFNMIPMVEHQILEALGLPCDYPLHQVVIRPLRLNHRDPRQCLKRHASCRVVVFDHTRGRPHGKNASSLSLSQDEMTGQKVTDLRETGEEDVTIRFRHSFRPHRV